MSKDPRIVSKSDNVDRLIDIGRLCKNAQSIQGLLPLSWCDRLHEAVVELSKRESEDREDNKEGSKEGSKEGNKEKGDDSSAVLETNAGRETEQNLAVELEFSLDGHRLRRIVGKVTGQVRLICQRCLEPFDCPIEADVSLAYFESEEAVQKADDRDQLPDDVEVVVVAGHANNGNVGDEGTAESDNDDSSDKGATRWVSIAQLLEDDLLLALPQVPKHLSIEEGGAGCPKKDVMDVMAELEEQKPKEERNEQLAEGLAAIRDKLRTQQD